MFDRCWSYGYGAGASVRGSGLCIEAAHFPISCAHPSQSHCSFVVRGPRTATGLVPGCALLLPGGMLFVAY